MKWQKFYEKHINQDSSYNENLRVRYDLIRDGKMAHPGNEGHKIAVSAGARNKRERPRVKVWAGFQQVGRAVPTCLGNWWGTVTTFCYEVADI